MSVRSVRPRSRAQASACARSARPTPDPSAASVVAMTEMCAWRVPKKSVVTRTWTQPATAPDCSAIQTSLSASPAVTAAIISRASAVAMSSGLRHGGKSNEVSRSASARSASWSDVRAALIVMRASRYHGRGSRLAGSRLGRGWGGLGLGARAGSGLGLGLGSGKSIQIIDGRFPTQRSSRVPSPESRAASPEPRFTYNVTLAANCNARGPPDPNTPPAVVTGRPNFDDRR